MNRTLKEATVHRYHYDSHQQLRRHLDDFVNAYNFGRRLKTLKGLANRMSTVYCRCGKRSGMKTQRESMRPTRFRPRRLITPSAAPH